MAQISHDQLVAFIADKLSVGVADVKPEAELVKDLGADSLALVELGMEFEDVFGIRISDQAMEQIRTVGDLFDYVDKYEAE